MKPVFIPIAAMAGLAWLLGGCGRERTVIAGGTEQPNEIVGSVLSDRNEPARSAQVILRSGSFDPGDSSLTKSISSILATSVSDSTGRFAIKRPPSSPFFLEMRSADSNGIALVTPSQEYSGQSLMLDPTRMSEAVGLRGSLFAPNPAIFSMALAGTPFQARVSDSGKFRFPQVLPGRYTLLAEVYREGGPTLLAMDSLVLSPGSVVDMDSLLPPLDSMPLFSFEDPKVRSHLRGILFPRLDSTAGRMQIGTKLVNSVPVEDAVSELSLLSPGSYRGKSLRIHMRANQQYALNLGHGYYDFTKPAALVFYARTVGDTLPVTLLFHTQSIPNTGSSFRAKTRILSQWSRIAISQNDIAGENGSDTTLTWNQARTAVVRVALMSARDADLWIDDIHLVGLSYVDLLSKDK
jgi:hypothetical protein